MFKLHAAAVAVALLSMGAAHADPAPRDAKRPPEQSKSETKSGRDRATDIVTQPARDVGVSRREIPPPLVKASQAPYSLVGLKNCRQLASEVQQLNQVLGPDFQGEIYRENRMAKFAEAGGKTVVNSLIPFRSLVREVTGAAPADRRQQAAINAGLARRGYLRGVYATRGCRPRL